MAGFPLWIWILIGFVAAITPLGILHIFACSIRESLRAHRLRCEVMALRNGYLAEVFEIEGAVDIIADDESEPALPLAA